MLAIVAFLVAAPATAQGRISEPLSLDDALAIAFARNRDVIAARLGVSAAEVERIAAGLLPNPTLSYTVANFVLGQGTIECFIPPSASPSNPGSPMCVREGFATDLVHGVGVAWELEVWGRRHLRIDVARLGIEAARLDLSDALRTVAAAVTSAFLSLQHAEEVRELAVSVNRGYAETVRVSRERAKRGDLAGSEVSKIELTRLQFQAAEVNANAERALAERALKELLALPPSPITSSVSSTVGPTTPATKYLEIKAIPVATDLRFDLAGLTDFAYAHRPDLLAAATAKQQSERALILARRLPYPNPALSLTYTHSTNIPAGDNANTLSAGLSVPLPIFDRSQADRARAAVAVSSAENALEKLRITVAHDVAEAVIKASAAQTLVLTYERQEPDLYGTPTNMLERASVLLATARAAHRLGATSLLDLLEAQRSYIAVRVDYLAAVSSYRQALADLAVSVGKTGIAGLNSVAATQ